MEDKTATLARSLQIIFFSAAILYLELAFIRYSASEVLYLGYFSNFVLLSVFVGLGLGFLSARGEKESEHGFRYFPILFLFFFALILVAHFDVDFLKGRDGLFFFGNIRGSSGLPGWILLFILFAVVASLFLILAREVANLFRFFKPLQAYTLDISGSLLGISLFSVQSLVGAEPITWVLTAGFLLSMAVLAAPGGLQFSKRRLCEIIGAVVSVILLLLAAQSKAFVMWSPYQKLLIQLRSSDPQNKIYEIYANGVLHQFISRPEIAKEGWYGVPYATQMAGGGKVDDVLIIGAGSGTDLSVGLSMPTKSIDAVDIDNGIVELGRRFNDSKPYSDPRVTTHIGDGRAFLRQTQKKYDLIIFALPDSLMRISSLSNVRLESYLFTIESFQDVKRLLKPDGSFFLYNQFRWDWLKNKISEMLETVFGKAPGRLEVDRTTVLGVGGHIPPSPYSKEGYRQLATDDWPNVYMQEPQVSWFYLCMIAMFLVASILGIYFLAPRGTLLKPDFPFFFMGAAFLLLEAKSISLFSLLFGTTWFVNSLVFSGILICVLFANFLMSRYRVRNRSYLFLGLTVAVLAAYAIRPADLLNISNIYFRYLFSILLYFSPIFFANLIFSREFRDLKHSQMAFGWNLLGAVMGGGLEYFGLVLGNRNLLWLVLIFYGLSWISLRANSKGEARLS